MALPDPLPMPDVNFTNIMDTFADWIFQGYKTPFLGVEALFWVLFFSAIVGYVYIRQGSAMSAGIAILIIIGAFGRYIVGVDTWIVMMLLIFAFGMTGLIMKFILPYVRNR